LLTAEEDYHIAIHNTRRNIKKIRAAWRLIRFDLKEGDFENKNQFYRDEARRLSDLRDATALLETLQHLKKHYGSVVSEEAFAGLETWLHEERSELAESGEGRPPILGVVAENLRTKSAEINQFELPKDDWREGVVEGLRRVYRRGFRGSQINAANGAREEMHEWRKRAKYLRYHLEILQGVWPELFGTWASEMHRLTDQLGEYNNLAVLQQKLLSDPGTLAPAIIDTTLAISAQEQENFHQQAIRLGQLLYLERPGAFARRMAGYLSLF